MLIIIPHVFNYPFSIVNWYYHIIKLTGTYICKMAQHFFQMKQFKIKQDKCAMKVCTDACLFGALVAATVTGKDKVLDIGAGTGLLSLMYAQKNNSSFIDAVEIDEDAFIRAKENFSQCEWKENIRVYNQSVQQFSLDKNEKYNLIISNPPFYENDLKSADTQRNRAFHASGLSFAELIKTASALLKETGFFCVLISYSRTEEFERLAKMHGLFIQTKYLIKQTENHSFFRTIFFLRKSVHQTATKIITVKIRDKYSPEFETLLKDYYLYL